jgi:outer membrane protein assembly factor BamB
VAETAIYAIDWTNGNFNWRFEKDAPPFETSYTGSGGQTVYPFQGAAMCVDGKLYAYSSKHSAETPFYRGSPLVCIDVFTGKEIWSIGMNGAGEFGRLATQITFGDGYMTFGARNGVMYTFGIGLSETTVSAPQLPLTLGQRPLLTGTVLDLSPAQVGAPCVSKESMAAQMEHLHLQTQIGGIYGNVTMVGVDVVLFALDPNGNDVYIGTVKSDGYSGTFAFDAWTPEVSGLYTITATFMGDESYDSSFATTYITVAEGENTSTDNTLLYALIGATVAIIVVMIVCFILFRKK